MSVTPRGIATPDGSSDWDIVSELANMAVTIDNAIDDVAVGANFYVGTAAARAAALSAGAEGDTWQDTDGERVLWMLRAGVWVPKHPMSVYELSSGALQSSAWTVLSNSAAWTAKGSAMTWANGVKIPRNGIYEVSFGARVAANLSIFSALKKNNTATSSAGVIAMNASTGFAAETAASVSRVVSLVTNDVITPALYTTGTAGPYGLTPDSTFFSVVHLRDA